MSMRRSPNYRILRNILSKTRQIDAFPELSYLIVYAFLYKYSSDALKNHFLDALENKALTLDEAYGDGECREIFRTEALHTFGFFIKEPDFFMDEVINNFYPDRFFIHQFFEAFSRNVEFLEGSNCEKYFNFIFDSVSQEINLNKFEFEGENHLIIKDIIYSISRLDISDGSYPFERVFDNICKSRVMHLDQDPDYINLALAGLVSQLKDAPIDVYNPFLNDASSLVDLALLCRHGIVNSFGKGFDKITYCASIVKLLIYDFKLENVFLEFSSPFESADFNSASFDVIISKIPAITPKNMKRINRNQNLQIAKRNKRKQLEGLLASKFDMDEDSFLSDNDLNDAIDNLISKMDLEKESEIEFVGEYESLRQSEYLFLINLINCLKDDGIMVVCMSQSFLFKNSLQTLRKYLTVEKNCIDAIISIPDELSRPQRSEIIVVFRKNKLSDDIVFIDMSRQYVALPTPHAVPGLFKRNLILSGDTLARIVEVYKKRQTVDKFSNVVDITEFEKNEYNLSISRYVDTFEGDFINLRDLKYEKRDLDENARKINKKIERMMDELGIRF